MIGLFSGIFIISIYAFKLLMNSVNKEFINWSSAVSHLGFGLLLFSIAGNSIFSYEKNLKLNVNEEYISEELEISFDDLSLQDESNHQRIIAQINMKIHDKVISFSPEKRKYFTRGQVTSETDIEATFLRDIYINIGEQLDDGSWTFRVQFNYLIKWIWFSVLLMILGILIRSRAMV
jgi:cytochrome c-type biogenesis protein CcmF